MSVRGLKYENACHIDKLGVSAVKWSGSLLVAVELPTISSDVASKGPEESTVSGEEVICD